MPNLNEILAILQLESLAALKAKDSSKRAIISTIISDLKTDGKQPSDDTGLDKAFATLKQYRTALDKGGDMQPYIDVLEPLLPKQLTRDELIAIVAEQGFTDMGSAMKWFKQSENKHLSFEPGVLRTCFV